MSYACAFYEAAVECPHCDLLRCACHFPGRDEDAAPGNHHLVVYECKQCHATWTLGENWGAWDPPPKPFVAVVHIEIPPDDKPPALVAAAEAIAHVCMTEDTDETIDTEEPAEEPKG